MIDKMRFVSLSGPLGSLDKMVSEFLTKYDIHLENALSEFQDSHHLRPIMEPDPYQKPLATLSLLKERVSVEGVVPTEMDADRALSKANEISDNLESFNDRLKELEKELAGVNENLVAIAPYGGLDVDLKSIIAMKHIKYRFGRIGTEYFRKFEEIINNSTAIFIPSSKTQDFVYGVYFVPMSDYERLDAQLFSIHFERFHVPVIDDGTPGEICDKLEKQKQTLENQIKEIDAQIDAELSKDCADILGAERSLSLAHSCFEIRKKAACTKEQTGTSFILCGWMPVDQADMLNDELGKIEEFRIVVEDENGARSKPPTKFHNIGLFKPFEMYTEMYGLPAYNEFDPTIFIGLTYSFIFGWMFGDVGQGLVLTILGFLLYKAKKMKLAGIISCAGVFSTFFGFMFGSIFGFEEIIPAYWLRAQEAMSNLPLVGNLNTVFAVAVVFGMGMILITMILNIINSLKVKDYENGLFSQNGIAGLIFYGTLAATIILFMTGNSILGGAILAVLLILPVICMALKEPLTAMITKKKEESETGIGMFIAQAFFELFEIMLSFFSNTLSFVRIGAFAVSHAAMMQVVLMLAGAESGSPNIVVVILGNIFVMGMEGLVVGIQVLRLEYYEFFSRFYRGTGRAFVSFKDSLNR